MEVSGRKWELFRDRGGFIGIIGVIPYRRAFCESIMSQIIITCS